MDLSISVRTKDKLANKHAVTENEIEQCFLNRTGKYLYDLREQHQTDPKTRWFIAETNHGRLLKICFIPKTGGAIIRTAYEPNTNEINIYEKYGY